MTEEERKARTAEKSRRWRAANPEKSRRVQERKVLKRLMAARSAGADIPSPALLSAKEQLALHQRLRREEERRIEQIDPARREKRLKRDRAILARRKAKIEGDPEAKAARRAKLRRKWANRHARLRSTPEGRERIREKSRLQRARSLERDPEAFRAKVRAKNDRRKKWAKVRAELSQEARLRGLRKLIPGYLPPHARDDVLSDLTLAMLEGQCTPDMVRATIKQAASRYSAELWKELSLDATVPGMEGVTFLDLLAQGAA